MLLKSIKTKTAIIFLSLCVSSTYPLTETAARNWAIALGAVPGVGAGVGTAVGINLLKNAPLTCSADTFRTVRGVAGVAVGAGAWALSSYAIYQYLYQYTPGPVIESAKKTIKQVEKDSAYAQDFLTLSQADVFAQLSAKFGQNTAMEKTLDQFNGFVKDLDDVIDRLDRIKNDLDGKDMVKAYEKIKKQADALKSYINVRYALVVVFFATTDTLLNREFKSYSEFGTNGQPTIDEVISQLGELRNNLNTAQQSLNALISDKNSKDDFKSSIYSLKDLASAAKLLKNIVDLRIAQAKAFLTEKSFAADQILSKYFVGERDLTTYLNAHSQTSWPLIDVKKTLNKELADRKQAYQSVSKILNSFEQDQSEYRRQSAAVLDKLQGLINIVETNLNFIAQSKEYFNQVRLYEEHLEREHQIKLEQERFERQQALEREKIAEANRRESARLAQERQLAWEKQLLEEKKAEDRRKHEQDLLDQKLAQERALQQQKLNQQTGITQTPSTATNPPAYNPYQIIDEPLPTPSAPPAPQNYSDDQPPSYESLFPTPPAYNPSYVINDPLPTPSAPPAPKDYSSDKVSQAGYSTTAQR
ncbi:MAG: hypothetical protein US49_C0005G0091 [candidate division TM6 bacterium GW2011_GWF2_37_49]|nr:MAG: hypothetical protein US49_C0005G0091 [candidate division TM6 bacterium GW2011_GWF2_37_49]